LVHFSFFAQFVGAAFLTLSSHEFNQAYLSPSKVSRVQEAIALMPP
jgi:hypothetical protein